MRSKFCKLSASVALVTLAIAAAAVAQEVSQKVQVRSSELNIRLVGKTAIANPIGSKAAAAGPRESLLSLGQSQLVKMHYLAHDWGRILAEHKWGFTGSQRMSAPLVTPLPVIGADRGFSGFPALTGAQQASVSGGDLEPPDQGLCTDGTVVLEAVNVAGSVYQAATHKVLAGPFFLNDFFGVPATDFTSDPRCYYDPPTQRWFVTVTDVGTPSFLLLAVSQTSDPTGFFDLYAIDTTNDGFFSVCPCFADQPLIGSDNNGFYISTNSYGAVYFGGAQIYALSKFALVLGLIPFGVHLAPLPAPGGPLPFSLHPATSPSGQGAAANGGTEYFVSSYDITSPTNSKVSLWALTNTDTLTAVPGVPGFTTLAVNTEPYVVPIPASQKAGPIPLGKSLGQLEGTLDAGDQRMQQVIYADGNLWSSVDTAIQVSGQTLDGAAYFVIRPSWSSGALRASVARQGYVAAANNNLLYPAVGVSDNGNGAIVFTLSGPNYFPSAAYIPISLASGIATNGIRLAAAGALPDDGFTEYAGTCPACTGPPGRWGDYSAAVGIGDDSIWLATEYISSKPRDQFTNWTTFIGVLPLPDGD